MKRLILCLGAFFLCVAIQAQEFTLLDFKKHYTHELLYDDDFNPILKLTLTNPTSKVITSLEIVIDYGSSQSFNYFSPTETKIVKVNIGFRDTETVSVRFPKEKGGKKPTGFSITKVRYSDGSICDK